MVFELSERLLYRMFKFPVIPPGRLFYLFLMIAVNRYEMLFSDVV